MRKMCITISKHLSFDEFKIAVILKINSTQFVTWTNLCVLFPPHNIYWLYVNVTRTIIVMIDLLRLWNESELAYYLEQKRVLLTINMSEFQNRRNVTIFIHFINFAKILYLCNVRPLLVFIFIFIRNTEKYMRWVKTLMSCFSRIFQLQ